MPKPIKHSQRYVPGLDGLRTLAVIAVILYHLEVPHVVGGLLGVGVFFTLSGYLITTNLMNSWNKRGNLGLKTFWFRRFRRLVPAVIVTLISVVILTAALDRPKLGEKTGEALSALFYVNNWHNIIAGDSYFDRFDGPGSLSHMWSLSVEEQFYLIWPLVLLGILMLLRKRSRAIIATLVITVISFAWMWFVANPGLDNTRAYEGTDTRAGGLLLGAALAIWLTTREHNGKSKVPNPFVATVTGTIGIVGIVVLIFFVPQESIFLYRGGLALLSVFSVLAIFSLLRTNGIWGKIFGFGPVRWFGERSYGIYLWHMPAIAFLPHSWIEDHKFWVAVLVCAVSTALAAISWTLIEDPIRRHGIIQPFRDWRKGRKAAEGLGEDQPWLSSALRFPHYFTAGAGVVLLGIVSMGLPPVLAGAPFTAQAQTDQKLVLDSDAQKAAAKAGGTDGDTAEKKNDGEENSADTTDKNEDGEGGVQKKTATVDERQQMWCDTVIHVGDSTSIGMFDPEQVTAPDQSAFNQYKLYGADNVVDSVFGARSTTEGWNSPDGDSYPSAVDSVTELLPQYRDQDGVCWVVATGVNDAANHAVGADLDAAERIDAMMDLLDGQNVLWPMVTTDTQSGAYDDANMRTFNEALKQAEKRYPKLRLYDWPAEVDYAWFSEGDYAHYGPQGNSERAKRFAAALAAAFPADNDGKPAGDKILRSGF